MPTTPITDEEKVWARHHLGVANVSEGNYMQAGLVSKVPYSNLVESAFEAVRDDALPLFRLLLTRLGQLEKHMQCSTENADVNQVESIQLNNQGPDNVQETLRRSYEWNRSELANLMNIDLTALDQRRGIYRTRRSFNTRVMGG